MAAVDDPGDGGRYDALVIAAHPDDAEAQMGGTIALLTISSNLPCGVGGVLGKLAGTPGGALLARDRMPAETFFSYMFIPFSSIMFPHMAIMCLSAKKLSALERVETLLGLGRAQI